MIDPLGVVVEFGKLKVIIAPGWVGVGVSNMITPSPTSTPVEPAVSRPGEGSPVTLVSVPPKFDGPDSTEPIMESSSLHDFSFIKSIESR